MVTIHKKELIYDIDQCTHKISKRFLDNPDLSNEIQTGDNERDILIRYIDFYAEKVRQISRNKDSIIDDNKSGDEGDITYNYYFPDNTVMNTLSLSIHNYIVTSVLFEYLKMILPQEARIYKEMSDQSYSEVKSLLNRRRPVKRSSAWL